jgi:hypothetical protein
LTHTIRTPAAGVSGAVVVERSMMLSAEKSTRSAFAPTAITPRPWRPMLRAGKDVIFRTASSSEMTRCSRTYRPSTRGNAPNPRGCRPASSPSVEMLDQGQAISFATSASSMLVPMTPSTSSAPFALSASASAMSRISVVAGSVPRSREISATVLPT